MYKFILILVILNEQCRLEETKYNSNNKDECLNCF